MDDITVITPAEIKHELKHDTKGQITECISNFLEIFRHDAQYSNIYFNEIANCAEIHNWKNGELSISKWSDSEDAGSRYYCESAYGLYLKEKHSDAFKVFLTERVYNPIKGIVESIKWDGKERIHDTLHKWLLADDTPYVRECSRLIFAGGIWRLYNPGCKFDDVVLLIGKQGGGKSTFTRWLAINDNYYGEIKQMDGASAIEQLQGKWILEASEMMATTKTRDQETCKAFITRCVDSYRMPYDRLTSELPRRCIFIGTTNNYQPLTDSTGNRRYYPVECQANGYDLFGKETECREYILQCWAEAREKYKAGKMPNFADRSLIEDYRNAQQRATQDDWREGAIKAFLDRKSVGEITCVREICREALSANRDFPQDPKPIDSREIGIIMSKMDGWKRYEGARKIGDYGLQRGWVKIAGNAQNDAGNELPL